MMMNRMLLLEVCISNSFFWVYLVVVVNVVNVGVVNVVVYDSVKLEHYHYHYQYYVFDVVP